MERRGGGGLTKETAGRNQLFIHPISKSSRIKVGKQASKQRKEKKNDTHQNNDNQSPIWLLDFECKRNQEDGHRVEGLEHLDKRDAQSKVSIVGQDE